MFGKKKVNPIPYDAEKEWPAVKISICTGERVAGFQDKVSRKFRDAMLIRSDKELDEFCLACGVSAEELKKIV